MINKIPIIGWILSATAAISLSVPFWFCWSLWGVGERYFYFLPTQYHSIPFWDCVGLFIVIAIIKGAFFPKNMFTVSNSQKVDLTEDEIIHGEKSS